MLSQAQTSFSGKLEICWLKRPIFRNTMEIRTYSQLVSRVKLRSYFHVRLKQTTLWLGYSSAT